MSNILQILMAAIRDLLRRNAAQIAAIANVFRHGKIGIQAEGLRQVAGLGTHLARRAAKDVRDAGGCFHHAGKNLEGRGLARSIRANQAKNLAGLDFKRDSADGLELAIALRQAANINGGAARADGLRARPPPSGALDLDWQRSLRCA
jgi:hypothetical protein